MGRIKKVATERHTASLCPFIATYVQEAASTPLHQLPAKLDSFPQPWPFPRGDIYHWIALLDRFDHILELFNQEYGLDKGPQQQDFKRGLLHKGDAEEGMPYPSEGAKDAELDSMDYALDGDRELVDAILHFTRVLIEHCGNRSLYASSSRINDLLQTTSLSLLRSALRLSLRLAQRYQAARFKHSNPHTQATLLASIYNFNFDHLTKIAQPFPKPSHTNAAPGLTPGKGKERASLASAYNPSDLSAIAKNPKATAAKADLASVQLTYYEQTPPSQRPTSSHKPSEATPGTPTPAVRASVLGPSRDRPSMGDRSATTAGGDGPTPQKSKDVDTIPTSSAPKTYSITSTKMSETPAWALVREASAKLPKDSHYDLLHRVRVAKAFTTPEQSAQLLLETRLLAIANLVFSSGESKFQERVGTADSEEQKRFRLAHQLPDLLQPATNEQTPLTLDCETAVILTIEALSKSRHKAAEVAEALQITQNHGVLYYELRKVISALHAKEHQNQKQELREAEWREAVFDLTNALLQSNLQARHGQNMVSAGIMGILIEVLTLRTSRAERLFEKTLGFFDSFIHGISTAFQTLANIKGLEILADLMSYEVTTALQCVRNSDGLLPEYKSKVIDYTIPFVQQATIRQLFRFLIHMYEHNAGTHDRLLRNLIDTPPVLGALRSVIDNAGIFGSNVWISGVNIVSSFIHNEPTSFQVVSEAGLVKSFLQNIVPWDGPDPPDANRNLASINTNLNYKDGELQYPTASGILPVGETMTDIPTAFGAICLNGSGMELFQKSNALYGYMDIFVSPVHIRALEEDSQTASNIGQHFDELWRHHPSLQADITWVVKSMVKRVAEVCKYLAERKAVGTKLYERTESGFSIAGGRRGLAGPLSSTTRDEFATLDLADVQEDDTDGGRAMQMANACFKFMEGLFHNHGLCKAFCREGGVIPLLDIAAAASNPHDLPSFPLWGKIASVFKTMCEQSPHLVLPVVLDRARTVVAELKPFVDNDDAQGIFRPFIDLTEPRRSPFPKDTDGTTIVKSLGMTQLLAHVLGRALAPPMYQNRHVQPHHIFTLVNFADIYSDLINNLSRLHAACVWENQVLMQCLPQSWKAQTDPKALMLRRVNAAGVVEIAHESRWDVQTNGSSDDGAANGPAPDSREESLAIKNTKTLRYLLQRNSDIIDGLFHALAQAIAPQQQKPRYADAPASKQYASAVAETLAKALIWELDFKKFTGADEIITSRATLAALVTCTKVLIKPMDRQAPQEALSMVLNKFYHLGGFGKLNGLLKHFSETLARDGEDSPLGHCAREALSRILEFYKEVVRSKCINEAAQSSTMVIKSVKNADYFVPGQFVVEVRNAIVPSISELWHSDALEKIGVAPARAIIEIMRTIMKGEGETHALKRSDGATRRVHITTFDYRPQNPQLFNKLRENRASDDLAREAIYRCNNDDLRSKEYVSFQQNFERHAEFPPPALSNEPIFPSTGSAAPRDRSVDMSDAPQDGVEPSTTSDERTDTASPSPEHEPARVSGLPDDVQDRDRAAMAPGGRVEDTFRFGRDNLPSNPSADLPCRDTGELFATVEDLDDKRRHMREDLIDRCLEVLSAQTSITFELAELIQAAVSKSGDSANPRADIGRTLVSSLLSLQGEEPSEESGAKISAYAHLVALILQEQDFFYSTLDELKEYFDALVSWIQLAPEQKLEDAPWIEMILLIIERVLVEDEQPPEIKWEPPPANDPLKTLPEIEAAEPIVEDESRATLFSAVMDLLPKIGKNSSLALSTSRILVILTRRRELAKSMSDKQSMSKLFMMVRQLAGSVNEKLQSAFMIILRHMIEDEHTLTDIMRTEIRGLFETHRTSRPMDTSTYTRNLHHLVLRDPMLFVDVTKDMVEAVRYDGNPHRGQTLALKKEKPAASPEKPEETETGVQTTVEEGAAGDKKVAESKPPVVETTDGIIQFLLRELSNYRDVEDTPISPPKEKSENVAQDVDMTDASTPSASSETISAATPDGNKTEKPTFKPEENVIYIYRCFLMQCLAEILASYTRTKIEFINFSRKAEVQPATPSKPRAGTLNYLLNMLIPVGTLEHRDDIAHRKKLSTSYWATTVVVSLCSRTPEFHTTREMRTSATKEDSPELTYVQKFVLEHALRSFKEATMSAEPLDQRYSRLLALAELFNRMLSGKSDRGNHMAQDREQGVSKHIGKLMYEKNYVSAITSAIAEIDLNFPNAKRAVKYILGPLKLLTDLGIYLSQDSDFSSSAIGTSEEEDISSATSISEDDEQEEREATPDLYRNSALGMFEPSRHAREQSDSDEGDDEDDDEDMYEDGYEDEMDYEEEPIAEHGDVVSDDDEDDEEINAMGEGPGDIEGMPGDVDMDIEVVMDGDQDDGESGDSEDDDEEDSDDDSDGSQAFADHIDQMDEINGDNENDSLGDHDEDGEWEEDDGADFEFGAAEDGGSPHGGPLDQIARVIGGGDDRSDTAEQAIIDQAMGRGGDEEYFDDEMPPEEEDDEEDEEIDYGDDVIYEPDLEEDEDDEAGNQWDQPPAAIIRGHHHHHHRHGGLHDMFALGGMGVPPVQRQPANANARGEDDGTNPLLLQREGAGQNRDRLDNADFSRFGRRPIMPRQGEALLQDLMATVGPAATGTINISVDGNFAGLRGGPMNMPMFAVQGRHGGHALLDFDPTRTLREQMPRWVDLAGPRAGEARSPHGQEAQAVDFRQIPTVTRWQEEARMLFGGKHHEKATRIINALLRALVPPAMEAKRQADIEDARLVALAEERRKKEEEERKVREEQERKEREEREAREAEEKRVQEEAERQAAAAADETSMEGVESSKVEEPPETAAQPTTSAPEPEADAPRVTTTIRGRELDITSLGVDLEYLEALPEELREEVIMSQFAEQRSQQVQSGGQPSEISREFLEALPPEIQRELLRSEAHDRRRREAEEVRRQAREQGGGQPAQPEEMNNADFMATLDPTLRQQILLDADDGVIAALPEEFQAEARVLGIGDGRPRPGRLARPAGGAMPAFGVHRPARAEQVIADVSRQRRPIMQMLDKPGIATLLRLMFVSLHQKAKGNLHSILADVCRNTQNRAEVISILLSILADGTADVQAVERSFAALSLRAKQLPGPKTPATTPLKRTATGSVVTPGAELSPLNIVQQCLATLNALNSDNPRVSSFFLSEHETISSQKAKSAKKGKGQDLRAAKYPINALLALLDRKLITENTGVMETLASLLSRVTHPLIMLIRRANAAAEADKKKLEEAEKKKVQEAEKQAEDVEKNAQEQARPQSASGDIQMGEAATEETAATDAPQAESSTNATEQPTTGEENQDGANAPEATASTEDKKRHELVPPEVPEENLRSVVNIITARECPGKTFTDTLDVIKHLSSLPGAKATFGRELVRQGQDLSQAVFVELEDLSKQISSAGTETDLQGLALTNFSSATSKQTKLLRVLTALDHVFDPKRTPELPSTADSQVLSKNDILAGLYESSTFLQLWNNLSQCLTAIRTRGNMVNVAAILLPLIEALMVVCGNSTLKEQTLDAGSSTPSAPSSEAKLESFFFKFTEEHRKILNELIRANPKLMNGALQLLAKNSKVLEFDNKRNYFNRKVHDRREQRAAHPSLQLNIRRDQVFLDSFKSLYYKSGAEIKYGKLNIRFHGEEGIDAGGVSREWFAAMSRQIFNPDYALFNPVASDRTTFHPNEFSSINEEHLHFFRFIGRIIGKALYEGRLLDCHFSRAVYRKILGKTVSIKDLESLELDHYKSLVWVLENDITDVITETFSIETDYFGEKVVVDLIPNGRTIEVTEANKTEWVHQIVEHKLIKSVEPQLNEFLQGFHEIIPAELVSIFNEQELELLISGLPDIDVDDWKNNSEYHNYQATSPQIQWFWRAVRSFDKEEKAKLLQFVTGTSKVPLNGFKELEGMNGFAKFNVHRDYSSKEKLPSSHTCFNQLDLPEYESYEHLRQQLYTAITAGSEYFGFA